MTVPAPVEEIPHGVRGIAMVWFPVLGPILAWTVHALFVAGVGRLTCTRPSTMTSVHVITGVTLAVCAVALVLSIRLARRGSRSAIADTGAARVRFLGLLGVAIGAFNVVLIVAEELYAVGLHPVRCSG